MSAADTSTFETQLHVLCVNGIDPQTLVSNLRLLDPDTRQHRAWTSLDTATKKKILKRYVTNIRDKSLPEASRGEYCLQLCNVASVGGRDALLEAGYLELVIDLLQQKVTCRSLQILATRGPFYSLRQLLHPPIPNRFKPQALLAVEAASKRFSNELKIWKENPCKVQPPLEVYWCLKTWCDLLEMKYVPKDWAWLVEFAVFFLNYEISEKCEEVMCPHERAVRIVRSLSQEIDFRNGENDSVVWAVFFQAGGLKQLENCIPPKHPKLNLTAESEALQAIGLTLCQTEESVVRSVLSLPPSFLSLFRSTIEHDKSKKNLVLRQNIQPIFDCVTDNAEEEYNEAGDEKSLQVYLDKLCLWLNNPDGRAVVSYWLSVYDLELDGTGRLVDFLELTSLFSNIRGPQSIHLDIDPGPMFEVFTPKVSQHLYHMACRAKENMRSQLVYPLRRIGSTSAFLARIDTDTATEMFKLGVCESIAQFVRTFFQPDYVGNPHELHIFSIVVSPFPSVLDMMYREYPSDIPKDEFLMIGSTSVDGMLEMVDRHGRLLKDMESRSEHDLKGLYEQNEQYFKRWRAERTQRLAEIQASRHSASPTDGKACAQCGIEASGEKKLRLCAGCKMVRYCSPECQKKHWPTHKMPCRANTKKV